MRREKRIPASCSHPNSSSKSDENKKPANEESKKKLNF